MATEEVEMAAATEEAKQSAGGGGLVKTIGLGFGLFFVVVVAQFTTSIVGCIAIPGLMPGCTQHLEEEEVTEEPGKGKNSKAKKDTKPKAPPQYLAFDPPLVVSFQDQSAMRFLQVTVEVMAREEKTIEAVKTHMPVIRNNLLMLLGGKAVADLTNRDGKEALRKEALGEVQKVLKDNTGKPGIEDLYFTSFVVQ
jgi:flagellar FliL protein